ncbi:FHA domain-containing protein [Bacteriovoracaceae bacterium]|nr:FHA domain-containing protein [Bacteriovoracaceae bacterium]
MAIFIIVKADEQKQKVRLTAKALTIGRSSKADLKIDDDKLSSIHASVELTHDSKVLFKDLGSTNGTFLNGSQIYESLLYVDDDILIGTQKITISKSDLNPRELKALSRDFEKTNMSFVNLKDKASPKEATASVSRVVDKHNLNKEAKPAKDSSNKTGLSHTAARVKEKLSNEKFSGEENVLDMDESSDKTQFIQIGSKETAKSKSKSKKKSKGKKKLKKKANKKEEKGLFSKIKKIFGD